jgi:hypothetical protein
MPAGMPPSAARRVKSPFNKKETLNPGNHSGMFDVQRSILDIHGRSPL